MLLLLPAAIAVCAGAATGALRVLLAFYACLSAGLSVGIIRLRRSHSASQRELQVVTDKLQAAARDLEALGSEQQARIARLRHDLKNPLQHVLAYSELLACDVADSWTAQHRRYLDNIRRGADGVLQVLDKNRD